MIAYPNIDPVAVQFGPVAIHWYGIMYLVGIGLGWWLLRLRVKRPGSGWDTEQLADLIFYVALGVILGGRIGYMLFYDLPNFLANPLIIFKVWNGGMSFHGGLLGVITAMWIYGRRHQRGFFELTDFIAPVVPIGLGAGRIGNFINGELWGKVTDVPWAVVYHGQPRHPSQLYEFLMEGVLLFVVLWTYSGRRPPRMAVSGMFALLYGIFRFLVEFVRLPDPQLGYLAFGWVTMGQILSTPMIAFGAWLLYRAYSRRAATPAGEPEKKTR
ncbi:MAG: prolipoprotein diacylglyceryl transferase [Gammaproteobacteria bacterium]|jgi:phosphatidylglycerol:prolipoprotein diacylglycerol transferase